MKHDLLLTNEEIGNVLETIDIDEPIEYHCSSGSIISTLDCSPVAQAQLNKTLKAFEQGKAGQERYKAGIKEVVEWIKEYGRITYELGRAEIAISHGRWHTKLKEWGVEMKEEQK